MSKRNLVAGSAGLIICTLSMIPLFLHSYGCDPYDQYLLPPPTDPATGLDNPFPIYECFSTLPLPLGGPAPVLCWVIALAGLILTARIADRAQTRAAIGVGVASPLLAVLVGFTISGLNPTLAFTDLDLFSVLALTVGFAGIVGGLEGRRRSN